MQYHEAANIFPMDDENLEALADDIRKHGQHVAIELLDGKVLDGRRRSAACILAGVDPVTVDVCPADPVAYVLSLNLHRRHLTASERAMVAARAREMYDAAAKERQRAGGGNHKAKAVVENLPQPDGGGKSRDAVGRALGVSGKSVDHATKVLRHGTPELIAAVDGGQMAVSKAAAIATAPEDVQVAAVSDPASRKSQYRPRGIGLRIAHEAIRVLRTIPYGDYFGKSAFRMVADWAAHNTPEEKAEVKCPAVTEVNLWRVRCDSGDNEEHYEIFTCYRDATDFARDINRELGEFEDQIAPQLATAYVTEEWVNVSGYTQ